eukprot:5651675-Amphidinium_carterae.1
MLYTFATLRSLMGGGRILRAEWLLTPLLDPIHDSTLDLALLVGMLDIAIPWGSPLALTQLGPCVRRGWKAQAGSSDAHFAWTCCVLTVCSKASVWAHGCIKVDFVLPCTLHR